MERDGTRELRAFFFGSKRCLIFVGDKGVGDKGVGDKGVGDKGVDAQVSNAASSGHFTEVGNPRRSRYLRLEVISLVPLMRFSGNVSGLRNHQTTSANASRCVLAQFT
jgi:hypothetical protein